VSGLLPALALLAFAQDPAAAPTADALERFAARDAIGKATLLRDLERRLRTDPDPAVQRIFALADALGDAPPAEPPRAHDPERWAKGVAPARTVVREGTAAHAAVRAKIPAQVLLPDLHRGVVYDWGRGAIVRCASLTFEQVFENCLRGYPPGTDRALAAVLAALDVDADERPIARYLGHLYADLDARAYEGVTLYEAWYSEAVIDVPDVDAIPFAKEILGSDAYRSPIPRGPGRTALYQQIRERAFAHRKHRTLREAAAAGFVRADPPLAATYANLAPRAQVLWAAAGDDPARAAAILTENGDRDAFLAAMGEALRDPAIGPRAEQRARDLRELAEKMRALALWELDR
jgi:hypothetical protein